MPEQTNFRNCRRHLGLTVARSGFATDRNRGTRPTRWLKCCWGSVAMAKRRYSAEGFHRPKMARRPPAGVPKRPLVSCVVFEYCNSADPAASYRGNRYRRYQAWSIRSSWDRMGQNGNQSRRCQCSSQWRHWLPLDWEIPTTHRSRMHPLFPRWSPQVLLEPCSNIPPVSRP